MKRVAIIFTGGTISMTHAAAGGGAVPTLSGADIAGSVPELAHRFEISNLDFGKFPGPHMTVARVLELRAMVENALQDHAGVVVSHGTDTLEESAFLLDLFHISDKPVVFVGAMRTRDEPSWDGPVNLLAACLVAASEQARGRGVMAVLNNTIHAASEVTKTSTGALDTFVSPECGPLGIVDLDEPIFYRSAIQRYRLPDSALSAPPARVEMLAAHNGSDGRLVDACVESGIRGLVVQAMGRGNVPPPMFAAIERAIAADVAVLICSRCWGGRAAPVYGYEGGGAKLRAAGAIYVPSLDAAKARLALSFLRGGNFSRGQIEHFFQTGGVG
jgi:L-asparaginase